MSRYTSPDGVWVVDYIDLFGTSGGDSAALRGEAAVDGWTFRIRHYGYLHGDRKTLTEVAAITGAPIEDLKEALCQLSAMLA